jgi:hypothetical protein
MLKNSWLFPVIESIHVVGLAAFVGSVVLVDLRLVTPQRLRGWTNAGLAILLLTGLILFSADPARYLHNPAFLFKMAVFVLAMVTHFTIRRATLRSTSRSTSRLAAIFSLILWTCVVIGGRAIADFDL